MSVASAPHRPGYPFIPDNDTPVYDKNGCTYIGVVTGYCVKCRSKTQMTNKTRVRLKNNRPAITGQCIICNCKMFRIGKI